MKIAEVYQDYVVALRGGDYRRALKVACQGLGQGINLHDLYLQVFQPALYAIGQLWEIGEASVADEHLAAAITSRVMDQLYVQVVAYPKPGRMLVSALGRTLVAACPQNEFHDLGLRMVSDFLSLEGWHTYFLGANVPTNAIVHMVNAHRADLLALSVTLTSHLIQVEEVIRTVRSSPVGHQIKVLVGGQAFHQVPSLASRIDADSIAVNAREAADWVSRCIG